MRPTPLLLAAALLAQACKSDHEPRRAAPIAATSRLPAPTRMDVHAAHGSLAPRLARVPEGGAVLSWLEPDAAGVALRWSVLAGAGAAGWSPPATAVSSPNLLPNSADVPGIAALGTGRLVAHWRETREPAGAGYDARAALSFDAGRTWEKPVTPHRDGTDTEHGFVAVFEASLPVEGARERAVRPAGPSSMDLTGGLLARDPSRDMTEIDAGLAWLDGRQAALSPQAFSAQLLTTTLESGGDVGRGVEQVLDERTCDCCPVAATRAGDVTVLAYRDRSADEERDIAVVRRQPAGEWSQPIRVHADGWRIVGCPVNGPALDADGKRVVVAWFTGAQDDARVLLAYSDDAGETWSEPSRIDVPGGRTIGHPGLAILRDGSAFVTYAAAPEGAMTVLARRVVRGAEPGPVLEVARGLIGIPQLVRSGPHLLLTWTERLPATDVAAETRQIRIARWDADALAGTDPLAP